MPRKKTSDEQSLLSKISVFAGSTAIAGGAGAAILHLMGYDVRVKRAMVTSALGMSTMIALKELLSTMGYTQSPNYDETMRVEYATYLTLAALAGLIGTLELDLLGIQDNYPLDLLQNTAAPTVGVGAAIATWVGTYHSLKWS